jgi:ligand-binding sensor domain-containing protein
MKITGGKRWWGGLAACLALGLPAAAQKPPLYTHWENYTTKNGMPAEKVLAVTVDGNRVWAGTEDGLVLIENGRVARVFTPAEGLANRVVTGIAVDKETGDVWVSTFGGISQYSGGIFKNYTNLTSGLANDIVYGIAVQGNNVWAATTAGISRMNLRTGAWTIVSERDAPMNEPWTYGIAAAPNEGKVYFAVWGGGVLEYDIAGNYWKPYRDPDGEMEIVLFRNQGLIHDIVANISYNSDTRMFWAATYFGLSGYDGRYWHNYLSTDSGLASDFVNATKSRGNEVWACTDKGLSYLNYKTNTWVTYRPGPENGDGKILITGPDERKTELETATSLAHNYVLNMDFQGDDIWVATERGLSHGKRESQKEGRVHEQSTSRN